MSRSSARFADLHCRTPAGSVLSDNQQPKASPFLERETETIRYIVKGLTYEQTARVMRISLSKVQTHVRNLYRKHGVSTQIQAASKARDHGII